MSEEIKKTLGRPKKGVTGRIVSIYLERDIFDNTYDLANEQVLSLSKYINKILKENISKIATKN